MNVSPRPSFGFTKHLHASEPVRRITRAIVLSSLVGFFAGLAAIVFDWMVDGVSHVTLGYLAGYKPEGPENAGQFFGHIADIDPVHFALVLVPMLGGLITGLLLYLAPEASGPGANAAIRAFHRQRGIIQFRVVVIKILASAVTIGTGGSGGREGPIAQIGAGTGASLARWLRLSDIDRRTLLVAGIGAGIGAVFHAPLAGAIFAVEVLYRDPDFEYEALIPAFFSAVIAYTTYALALLIVFKDVNAFEPLFALGDYTFQPLDAPILGIPITVMVIVVVAVSMVFTQLLRWTPVLFERIKVPSFIRPGIGGLGVGLTALMLFWLVTWTIDSNKGVDSLSVMGTGYSFLQSAFKDPGQFGLSLFFVIALGKTVTTVLTIGSGGSGGVFGPSMVIGACLGAVVGLVFSKLTNWVTPDQIGIFMLLGMASFFAASANTPLSTLIMVSELTGKYELLLPSMWCCALAYVLGRGFSVFDAQMSNRMASPAHRGDFIIDLLDGLTVRDALTQTRHRIITIPIGMTLHDVTDVATGTAQNSFPVLDDEENYYGLFSLYDIKQFLKDSDTEMGELAVAQDLANTHVPTLSLSSSLDVAVETFAQTNYNQLPVLDPMRPGNLIGILSMQEVINVYNAQLMKQHKKIKTTDLMG